MLVEKVYNIIFTELFDSKVLEMRKDKGRIQNTSNMVVILAGKFAITNDTVDMVNGLVEFLMKQQYPDGGYYNYSVKTT